MYIWSLPFSLLGIQLFAGVDFNLNEIYETLSILCVRWRKTGMSKEKYNYINSPADRMIIRCILKVERYACNDVVIIKHGGKAQRRLLMKACDIKETTQRNFHFQVARSLSNREPTVCPIGREHARKTRDRSILRKRVEACPRRSWQGKGGEKRDRASGTDDERVREPWVASGRKNELCEESKMLVTMGTSRVLSSWFPFLVVSFCIHSLTQSFARSFVLSFPRPLLEKTRGKTKSACDI